MDRIIVKTNADMARVLDWSRKLQGMAAVNSVVVLPFPEGEIEFQEEEMLLRFWDEGSPVVRFELLLSKNGTLEDWVKVVTWRCDMEDGGIADLKICADRTENKLVIGNLLTQDNTVGKCVRKFRALMLFTAYYREDIQRTRTVSRTGTKKGGTKKSGRNNRRMLTIRRYTISDEMLSELPAPKKEWHGYAESFGVRGHYRTYKNGKVVWVRPYTKHGRNEKKSDREYIL